MDDLHPADRGPAIAELVEDAHAARVDVEVAARHLWAIHREADRLAAARAGVGSGPVPVAPASRRVPRAAVPVLVVVLMMSSSGMALAASRTSLPGDVLYAVKRGTETAQLIFARDPSARAELQLAFARARLEELRQIGTTRPDYVPELVTAIAASLQEVEATSPEIAPAGRLILEQTTQQLASMELPSDITAAAVAAIAAPAAPGGGDPALVGPTASVPPLDAAVPTATATPTPAGSDPGTAAGGPPATATATPTPNPSAAGSPTASEGSPSPSASEGAGQAGGGLSPDPGVVTGGVPTGRPGTPQDEADETPPASEPSEASADGGSPSQAPAPRADDGPVAPAPQPTPEPSGGTPPPGPYTRG